MVERTGHVTDVGQQRVGWVDVRDRHDAATSADPPVVLIHGLGTSGAWWTPTIPFLAVRRRVLLVDLPGFGASRGRPFRLDTAADVLAEWLTAIGVDRADVVGHSMGGLIAADLAARHPDRVRRLVLVDSAGLALHRRVTRHLANVVRGGVRATPEMYVVALRSVLACGPVTITRAAHQVLAADLRPRLASIEAPTLVAWGARDLLLSPAYGQALAGSIRGARFVAIEGAAHSPMWEQPEAFARTLVGFLEEASTVGTAVAGAIPVVRAVVATPGPGGLLDASTGGRVVARYLAIGEDLVHLRVGRPDGPLDTPPIVFVHGLGAASRALVPTMRRLARRHVVIAPDLPGFGWSSAPDRILDVPELAAALVATLDAAGIGRAVLVGSSLGGHVAARVAADHPDRVLGLVLAGPLVDPAEPSLAGHVLRLLADLPRERPALWFDHLPGFLQAGLARSIGTFRHARAGDLARILPEVRAPLIVVRGGRDPLVSHTALTAAARLAPNGRALEIRGAGHAVVHSAPRAVARIVEELVATVAAGARPNGDGLLPMRIVTATHRRRPAARPRRTRAGPPRA
jgi:pimeloyl-ACP methyl ester carboxylesterase